MANIVLSLVSISRSSASGSRYSIVVNLWWILAALQQTVQNHNQISISPKNARDMAMTGSFLFAWLQCLLGICTTGVVRPKSRQSASSASPDAATSSPSTRWWCSSSVVAYSPVGSVAAEETADAAGMEPAARHPSEDAPFLSRLLLMWVAPLVWASFRKGRLEESDLPPMPQDSTPEQLSLAFNAAWKAERERAAAAAAAASSGGAGGSGCSPSLWRTLWALHWRRLVTISALWLVGCSSGLLTPMALQRILAVVESGGSSGGGSSVYLWAAALALGPWLDSVLGRNAWVRARALGVSMATTLSAALYSATLSLPPGARARYSVGQLSNMMSTDACRVMDCNVAAAMALTLSCFARLLCATAGLYLTLGGGGAAAASAASSLAVMVCIMLFVARTRKLTAAMAKGVAASRDVRQGGMAEALAGARTLKVMHLMGRALSSLRSARQAEVRHILRQEFVSAVIGSVLHTAPALMSVAAFLTHALCTGRTLPPSTAFAALFWISSLQFPMHVLPWAYTDTVKTHASFQRLVKLFDAVQDSTGNDSGGDSRSREEGDTPVNDSLRQCVPLQALGPAGTTVGAESVSAALSLRHATFSRSVLQQSSGEGESDKDADAGSVDCGVDAAGARISPASSLSTSCGSSDNEDSSGDGDGCDAQLLPCTAGEEGGEGVLERAARKLASVKEKASRSADNSGSQKQESVDEGEEAEVSVVEILRDVNLTVAPGQLVMIVGPVGSGKSTLLAGVTGELQCSAGACEVVGSMAYVAQRPWLQHMTVRQNILFGQQLDSGGGAAAADRYQRVLDVCCLRGDLAQLPQGEATKIGEEGVTLSGGQKQRVSLARAVYADADVYVLDDVLSALDAHVGRTVFEECVCGLLAGKTRLVATHQTQFMSHPCVDTIVMLDGRGGVAAVGSYAQLLAQGLSMGAAEGACHTPTTGGAGESKASDDSGEERETQRSCDDKEEEAGEEGKKAEDEFADTAQTGSIAWRHVKLYFQASGGCSQFLPLLLLMLLCEGVRLLSSWWVGVWSDGHSGLSLSVCVAIYTALGGVAALLSFLRSWAVTRWALTAANRLHLRMLRSVLSAPMSFFDTSPSGQVLNRFSKDQQALDSKLKGCVNGVGGSLLSLTAMLAVSLSAFPALLLPLLVLLLPIVASVTVYRVAGRDLRRLESITRSPILSHFAETVRGDATVRAFRRTQQFCGDNQRLLSPLMRSCSTMVFANMWLCIFLQTMGSLLVLAGTCGLLASLTAGSGGGGRLAVGSIGMALSLLTSLPGTLMHVAFSVMGAEVEMVALERVAEYVTELDSDPASLQLTDGSADDPASSPAAAAVAAGDGDIEMAMVTASECDATATAPPVAAASATADAVATTTTVAACGEGSEVVFHDVFMRYRPGLPTVLNGLSVTIPAGAKVAVVGRTGAGKSSLMGTLLRLYPTYGGRITIGGDDIASLPLSDLRQQRLTTILQEAVAFTGTLRSNLTAVFRTPEAAAAAAAVAAAEAAALESGGSVKGARAAVEEAGDEKRVACCAIPDSIPGLHEGQGDCDGDAAACAAEPFSDAQLWAALRQVSLHSVVRAHPQGLDMSVEEGGGNFSAGQRQLLSLARALLRVRPGGVVVCDEPASCVDAGTRATVLDTVLSMRSTLLLVCHRLDGLRRFHRVMVMDAGRVVEFGSPQQLLASDGSALRALIASSGHAL